MNIPDDLAFDLAEYESRRALVQTALRERGIDVLLVTSPSNTCWLTGFVASWYPPRLPVGVAIWADDGRRVFFDWTRHREFLPYGALYDEAEFVDYGTSHEEVAEQLARRSPGAKVALEWASPTPSSSVILPLAAELRRRGIDVVDGDWIVDTLRLAKSPAEQDRMRRAGRIADATFRALPGHLRLGMTELEVAALVTTLMSEKGGEVPAQHPLVASGPSAWREVHGFPSGRRLERGDIVSVDASAVVDRYHVNLSRVFSIGADNAAAAEMMDAAAQSLRVLCDTARLGKDPAPAMDAAEAALRARVPAENIWWTGGYAVGISFPPSWVGHAYLANDGPTRIRLDEGYTSNFESILSDRANECEAAAIDTVMMTADGLVSLSGLPRELVVVEV
ncbi:MAG TPA: Xaa-Pro peptidase family protein [Gemmatimonadaceae bacterium]